MTPSLSIKCRQHICPLDDVKTARQTFENVVDINCSPNQNLQGEENIFLYKNITAETYEVDGPANWLVNKALFKV
jgi:hypothetical protein